MFSERRYENKRFKSINSFSEYGFCQECSTVIQPMAGISAQQQLSLRQMAHSTAPAAMLQADVGNFQQRLCAHRVGIQLVLK